MYSQSNGFGLPSRTELQSLFLQKFGRPQETGWAPSRRWQFDYYQPADVYEALVARAVFKGCYWIDIGGGRSIFPENSQLAQSLVARCSTVVAVDPSPNVHQNVYVHQRIQSLIEEYKTEQQFDLATLRMVVEHVTEPVRLVQGLHRLLRPGGIAIVFTVNARSPVSMVSRLTPFGLHHPIKKFFWGGDEEDTFPVHYKMNSRRVLLNLFEQERFREVTFAYLDDLSTWARFGFMNYIELLCWRLLRKLRIRYPENCLLGVYQR